LKRRWAATKKAGVAVVPAAKTPAKKAKKRHISPETRKRIAEAAKQRWAAKKAAAEAPATTNRAKKKAAAAVVPATTKPAKKAVAAVVPATTEPAKKAVAAVVSATTEPAEKAAAEAPAK